MTIVWANCAINGLELGHPGESNATAVEKVGPFFSSCGGPAHQRRQEGMVERTLLALIAVASG